MYSDSQYARYDKDVDTSWPTQISNDTRHDWWHDIVKIYRANDRGLCRVQDYVEAIEQALAEDDERDLNKLDSKGKTALHAAMKNRNINAVQALIECGADINVVDIYGRTPLTCNRIIYKHIPKLYQLQCHIEQLIAFEMYVRNINMQWYCESLENNEVCIEEYDPAIVEKWRSKIIQAIPTTLERCQTRLNTMKRIQINEHITLYSLFNDGAEQLAYSSMKLRELEKIVKDENFFTVFGGFHGQLGSLVKLVYRRACYRRKLLPVVEDALRVLFKCEFPSLCSAAIIKNLNDFDLANVLEAVNLTQA